MRTWLKTRAVVFIHDLPQGPDAHHIPKHLGWEILEIWWPSEIWWPAFQRKLDVQKINI